MSVDEPASVTEACTPCRLNLFEAFGVELEYMIVAKDSLDVLPVTDQLIEAESGAIKSEIDLGKISWSNELALHVVELKTTAPERDLTLLAGDFQKHVERINNRLVKLTPSGQLLPSAMHPWMDPFKEMEIWPHEYSSVYEAYNRIFDCRGHGWANLQSVHLNLPFNGDEQFGRLHAAVRLLLPVLPGLAASSPLKDGSLTGILDNRLDVYQGNSARMCHPWPEDVIPEAGVHGRETIVVRFSNGCTTTSHRSIRMAFCRTSFSILAVRLPGSIEGSIEIRVIDIQECPAADLAVLQATVAVLKALCSEKWSTVEAQQAIEVEPLYKILSAAIHDADEAVIDDRDFLSLFDYHRPDCTVKQLWRHLVDQAPPAMNQSCVGALEVILSRGPLARRLLGSVSESGADRNNLRRLYANLADCLRSGEMFVP
jgi:carboxylate-amine ligase